MLLRCSFHSYTASLASFSIAATHCINRLPPSARRHIFQCVCDWSPHSSYACRLKINSALFQVTSLNKWTLPVREQTDKSGQACCLCWCVSIIHRDIHAARVKGSVSMEGIHAQICQSRLSFRWRRWIFHFSILNVIPQPGLHVSLVIVSSLE